MADPAPAPTGIPAAVSTLQDARSSAVADLAAANSEATAARQEMADAVSRKTTLEAEIDTIDRALAILGANQ